MTFLNQLPKEKRAKLTELIDRDIELLNKEREVIKSMRRKIGNRIAFMKDVKRSRQTIENLSKVLNHKRGRKS